KDFNNLIIPQIVQGTGFYTEQVPGRDPRFANGWTQPVAVKSDSLTQVPVNNAFGEAYGIELFVAKKNIMNQTNLSGWVSYSLAFADRYEDGVKYPFRFD